MRILKDIAIVCSIIKKNDNAGEKTNEEKENDPVVSAIVVGTVFCCRNGQ